MITGSLITPGVSPFADVGPCNELSRALNVAPRRLARPQDPAESMNITDFLAESSMLELRAAFWGEPHRSQWHEAAARTMVGYSGTAGGFTLPYDVGHRVIDRARALSAVWGMIRWQRTKYREWSCPVNGEVSRITGSRWGGFQASWGLSELTMPAATDSKLGRKNFVNTRCLILSQVSKDVWDDAEAVKFWLAECAYKEISAALENTIINGAGRVGPPGTAGPLGLISQPSTVVISKGGTSANAITPTNIDDMWMAIPEANSYSAVWMCNKATAGYIDTLAASGQWPEIQYLRAGADNRWSFATLKGRPLVLSEFCPVLGNPGDLIVWDPGDYLITYMPLTEISASPLAWTVGLGGIEYNSRQVDPLNTGMLALPDGAIDQRLSDQRYFDTDVLVCGWKLRVDFGSMWTKTVTGMDGNTYGPCAITAQR